MNEKNEYKKGDWIVVQMQDSGEDFAGTICDVSNYVKIDFGDDVVEVFSRDYLDENAVIYP